MHVLYRDTNGYVLFVERGTSASETHCKYGLESGIMVEERFSESTVSNVKIEELRDIYLH